MTWLQRYRIRSYIRSSIWILPVAGILAALGLVRVTNWIDAKIGLKSIADPGAARDLLGTLAASIFSLIVFVSSALLLAVQLASAQFTPRVISLLFRDRVTKLALGFFALNFTFTLSVHVSIRDSTPLVATRTAAYGCILSIAFFMYAIDHVGKFLRPSGIMGVVSFLGRDTISMIYPRQFHKSDTASSKSVADVTATAQVVASESVGVILAMDARGIAALAEQYDCVIEMVPQVGDFVSLDEPMFRIHHGKQSVPDRELSHSVAVGGERTIEQDPTFAFRIIVDIASKALSPAINDPTTAVLAIDQIHRLLRMVGKRELDEGHVSDCAGRTRFIYPTPDWEDFVYLAVTEIRHFGKESIQVTRRLRAMLENLIDTLPEERTPILRQELSRLQRSSDRNFPEIDDRTLAGEGDSQGVGGKSEKNRPNGATIST